MFDKYPIGSRWILRDPDSSRKREWRATVHSHLRCSEQIRCTLDGHSGTFTLTSTPLYPQDILHIGNLYPDVLKTNLMEA